MAGLSPPHMARFRGVMKMAAAVDTAVMETDMAAFPPGEIGHQVGEVPPRAGRDEDHAQGHGGMGLDDQGEQEGEGGQEDELGPQPDGRALGRDRDPLEIVQAQVQGHCRTSSAR